MVGGPGVLASLRCRVSFLTFAILFTAAVLVLGTVIFFYWRSQYGVWAQSRKKAAAVKREQAQVIKYD